MPIYSYNCPTCGYDLERIAATDARDNQQCERCGGELTRKMDAPGAVWNPTRSSGSMRT